MKVLDLEHIKVAFIHKMFKNITMTQERKLFPQRLIVFENKINLFMIVGLRFEGELRAS